MTNSETDLRALHLELRTLWGFTNHEADRLLGLKKGLPGEYSSIRTVRIRGIQATLNFVFAPFDSKGEEIETETDENGEPPQDPGDNPLVRRWLETEQTIDGGKCIPMDLLKEGSLGDLYKISGFIHEFIEPVDSLEPLEEDEDKGT